MVSQGKGTQQEQLDGREDWAAYPVPNLILQAKTQPG